jgi:signal transduction histidine kinase/predicted RNA-binding protein with RPS1 domain
MVGSAQYSVTSVQVVRLLPFGLLVTVDDGREGIIREREIAWDREGRRHWREHFAAGERLSAVLLGEGHDQRLELSLRLAHHDPWLDLSERYPIGKLADGVVTGIQPYGVFVEVEPGVTGLLHSSRLPLWAQKQPIQELFWPGDAVKVAVEFVELDRRRLKLRLADIQARRRDAPQSPHLSAPASTPDSTPARPSLDLLLRRSSPLSIVFVEDDSAQLEATASWLRKAGQRVLTAANAEDALALIRDERVDLFMIDLGLPGMSGAQALRIVAEQAPDMRRVLMTDWASANGSIDELDALRASGTHLLIKPFLPEDLLGVLHEAFDTAGAAARPSIVRSLPVAQDAVQVVAGQADISSLLARLRKLTRAHKVVLFALDPAQHRISVAAEEGAAGLRKEAVADLIYSPVRDVAEDQRLVQVPDIHSAVARVRYLKPLLAFQSCLGVPVPVDLIEQYALFIFWQCARPIDELYEEYAHAVAISAGALLERRHFQAHAVDMQRLALLGQLSRALVHEINHQLSPINFALNDLEEQYTQIAQLLPSAPEAAAGEVAQAQEVLHNLSKGVRRLTATAKLFGRMTIHNQEPMRYLDTIMEEVLGLVRDMADRAHITIVFRSESIQLPGRIPAVQIQQVLLNLLINAIQQISLGRPAEGGRIQLWAQRIQHNHRDLLEIGIVDDGPGIHRRLWETVFELGFTTRLAGGSGLGLYITRSLVENLGGRVFVTESAVLWGSTFVVELPLAS